MLNFEEAIKLIEREFNNLQREVTEIDLSDSTGQTLAEDIYADVNLPAFDNSSMDGFAINYAMNKTTWNITGEISAGNYKEYTIDKDSAIRIMTGGRIPVNTNAVIPIEDVIEDRSMLHLRDDVKIKLNQNIRFMGEDLKAGSIALRKDTFLKAKNISLVAACGKSKLKVYRKLSAGVLATGDELVEAAVNPGEDKVRATNLYSLLTAIKEVNMNSVSLGIVKDNKDLLRNSIVSALNSDLDILITSGGVSVGKYDHLKDIFREEGVETIFWRVNIKPGKPLFFGKYVKGNKIMLVFGLPGNPVSSLVGFELFIKPSILKIYGNEQFNSHIAILENPIKKRDTRRHFVRGILGFDAPTKKFRVQESGSQSSGNLAGLSNSNCLIVIPENMTDPQAGEEVECILI